MSTARMPRVGGGHAGAADARQARAPGAQSPNDAGVTGLSRVPRTGGTAARTPAAVAAVGVGSGGISGNASVSPIPEDVHMGPGLDDLLQHDPPPDPVLDRLRTLAYAKPTGLYTLEQKRANVDQAVHRFFYGQQMRAPRDLEVLLSILDERLHAAPPPGPSPQPAPDPVSAVGLQRSPTAAAALATPDSPGAGALRRRRTQAALATPPAPREELSVAEQVEADLSQAFSALKKKVSMHMDRTRSLVAMSTLPEHGDARGPHRPQSPEPPPQEQSPLAKQRSTRQLMRRSAAEEAAAVLAQSRSRSVPRMDRGGRSERSRGPDLPGGEYYAVSGEDGKAAHLSSFLIM